MNYYTIIVRNVFPSNMPGLSSYLVVESDRLHFKFDTFGDTYSVHRANMVKSEYDEWVRKESHRFINPHHGKPTRLLTVPIKSS